MVKPLPTLRCQSNFNQFEPISLSTLKRLIEHLRSFNSVHDIPPFCIIKDGFDVIGPYILSLMNLSLLVGCVPTAFKHVTKSSLDRNDHANYRLISKLLFLSKVLEKIVFLQIQPYLNTNNITDKFQSGFKPRHSTAC